MDDQTNQGPPNLTPQQGFELYRLRAEEFERNFYSIRTVEWQVAFQIYAGYAAVTTGFFTLKAEKAFGIAPIPLAVFSLILVTLIFGVGQFWQWQILKRLHFNQEMKFAYLDKLHQLGGKDYPRLSGPPAPGFSRWWAFVPMQILNIATVISIFVAVLNATPGCCCH